MSATEVSSSHDQYKRKQFIFILHLIGIAFSAISLIYSVKLLTEFVPHLRAFGAPLWLQGLVIFATVFHALFWLSWIILSLAAKDYLLTGNMWLKCLPILVYALLEVGLNALVHNWNGAIASGVILGLLYVHHSLTHWWKPYKLDVAGAHQTV